MQYRLHAGEIDVLEVERAPVASELARQRLDFFRAAAGENRPLPAARRLARDQFTGVAACAVEEPHSFSAHNPIPASIARFANNSGAKIGAPYRNRSRTFGAGRARFARRCRAKPIVPTTICAAMTHAVERRSWRSSGRSTSISRNA